LRARSPASILLSCPVLAYQSIIGTKLDVTKISTAALQRFASSFALHLNSATPAKQQSHRSHYMQSTDYISQTGIKTKEN